MQRNYPVFLVFHFIVINWSVSVVLFEELFQLFVLTLPILCFFNPHRGFTKVAVRYKDERVGVVKDNQVVERMSSSWLVKTSKGKNMVQRLWQPQFRRMDSKPRLKRMCMLKTKRAKKMLLKYNWIFHVSLTDFLCMH